MKLWLPLPPILTWKEPKAFVQKERPFPIFYGWMQFRIFLYLLLGGVGCWVVFLFSPMPSVPIWSFGCSLGLSLLVALSGVYGLPCLIHFSPSVARLYAKQLTLCRGGIDQRILKFAKIHRYEFETKPYGWVMSLYGYRGEKDRIAIALPNDDVKGKVEAILSAAGVPRRGNLPADNRRNEIVGNFLSQLNDYRANIRPYLRRFISIYLSFLGFSMALGIGVFYLKITHNLTHSELVSYSLLIVVFGGIAWLTTMGTRYQKRMAREMSLCCDHCGKSLVLPAAIQTFVRSQICVNCGQAVHRFD